MQVFTVQVLILVLVLVSQVLVLVLVLVDPVLVLILVIGGSVLVLVLVLVGSVLVNITGPQLVYLTSLGDLISTKKSRRPTSVDSNSLCGGLFTEFIKRCDTVCTVSLFRTSLCCKFN